MVKHQSQIFKKPTYQTWKIKLKKFLDILICRINTLSKEDKGLKISELSISLKKLENIGK